MTDMIGTDLTNGMDITVITIIRDQMVRDTADIITHKLNLVIRKQRKINSMSSIA